MSAARVLILVPFLLVLAACSVGGDNFSDLQQFMNEVRSRPKGSIEPLPRFEQYEPFTYNAASMRSPFQPPVKIYVASQRKGSKDIKPDENRVKQFLEGFNIDAFEMVGTLENEAGVFGLVRGGGGVHRVKRDDYLGRNNGRIISIDESKIDIIEIVPDGENGWLERPRSITLKERS